MCVLLSQPGGGDRQVSVCQQRTFSTHKRRFFIKSKDSADMNLFKQCVFDWARRETCCEAAPVRTASGQLSFSLPVTLDT